jgi:hypothetical protein
MNLIGAHLFHGGDFGVVVTNMWDIEWIRSPGSKFMAANTSRPRGHLSTSSKPSIFSTANDTLILL